MSRRAESTINATDVRKIFGEVIARAKHGGERFIVERGGEPYVAIIGVDQYEDLLQRLEDLEDVRDMIEAQQDERVPLRQYMRERGLAEQMPRSVGS